jgi:hypothetical protein
MQQQAGLADKFMASLTEKQYYQHWWSGKRTAAAFVFDASAVTRSEVDEHASWLLSTNADGWSAQNIADTQAQVVTAEVRLADKFMASLAEKQYYQHWWSGKRTAAAFVFDLPAATRSEVDGHASWLLSTNAAPPWTRVSKRILSRSELQLFVIPLLLC